MATFSSRTRRHRLAPHACDGALRVLSPKGLPLFFPPIAIAALEDLGRRAKLLVGGARHTERIAKIVDNVLIRSCYRPSRSLLTDAVRPPPIGIYITARLPPASRRLLNVWIRKSFSASRSRSVLTTTVSRAGGPCKASSGVLCRETRQPSQGATPLQVPCALLWELLRAEARASDPTLR